MSVDLRDHTALVAVSPAALAAYARSVGWRKIESYGEHSDVYAGCDKPEVIVPRTERLGDYPRVVSQLIHIFATVAQREELALYRELVTADRDVVRVRVAESDDGSVTVNDGIELISGARDMLLSVACSLGKQRQVYRAGANKGASDLLSQIRLGQTDQGSFVVTLLTPVVSPPLPALVPDLDDRGAPIGRRVTKRLVEALNATREALNATREATERIAGGDETAFGETVSSGVSANLCEALIRLIGAFPTLDVGISWARTRPVGAAGTVVRFAKADSPILREAARSLRDRAPRPDTRLHGFVQVLKRLEAQDDGTIRIVASIDGRKQSVTTVLERSDYDKAVMAHTSRALVVLTGDLEYMGHRWRLLNPRIADVIRDDGSEAE